MRIVFLILALSTLSGCGFLEFPLQASDPAPQKEEPSVMEQAALPDGTPEAVEPPQPELTAPAVGTPPRKPTPAPGEEAALPPKVLDPARLVGLGEGQVVAHLGEPVKIRHQGPATIWRYSASRCWMDVFFFADLATGNRQVLTYEIEARQIGDQPDAIGRCMELIQSESGQRG